MTRKKKGGGRLKLALFVFLGLVCDSGDAEIRCSDDRTVKVSTGCQASAVLMEFENVAPGQPTPKLRVTGRWCC